MKKKVREERETANALDPGRTPTRRRMVREIVARALEMSDAIDDPTTSLDDRAEHARRLDRMHAAAGGTSMAQLARMRLLETIQKSLARAPVEAMRFKIIRTLARRGLGETLSPEEIALLSSGDPEVVEQTKMFASVMNTSDPESQRQWRGILDIYSRRDDAEALRYNVREFFVQRFPEYRDTLSSASAVLEAAIVAFGRGRGQPRKTSTEPPKWEALAELMRTAGIGDITATSLEQEWNAWTHGRD